MRARTMRLEEEEEEEPIILIIMRLELLQCDKNLESTHWNDLREVGKGY
jgi:hypothetical protein